MAQIQVEECTHHEQLRKSEEHAMCYCIPTTAYQMSEARDRCHEGMLNCAFPALDSNHIGHALKSHTEVRPDRGPNQQVERERINLSLIHLTQHLRVFTDQRHAQGVN